MSLQFFFFFFVIASLIQINKISVGYLPVQNLRSKIHFHIWKRSAIPTAVIGCSFTNKAHVAETPKYSLKRKWLSYFREEENTSVVAPVFPSHTALVKRPKGGALGLKRSVRAWLRTGFHFASLQSFWQDSREAAEEGGSGAKLLRSDIPWCGSSPRNPRVYSSWYHFFFSGKKYRGVCFRGRTFSVLARRLSYLSTWDIFTGQPRAAAVLCLPWLGAGGTPSGWLPGV